jgi:hypothetical protein
MTSKKRKYGDLSARPLPTEDPSLIDDVFAAFTGTRPSSAVEQSPSPEDFTARDGPSTPARGATPAQQTAPAQGATPAQGAANKERKAFKENIIKGSSKITRLTPEEIQSFTSTVSDLLGEGQSIEEVEAKFAPNMHAVDWATIRSMALAQGAAKKGK